MHASAVATVLCALAIQYWRVTGISPVIWLLLTAAIDSVWLEVGSLIVIHDEFNLCV